MKTIFLVLALAISSTFSATYGQAKRSFGKSIEAYPIEITTNKTTNIIFPHAIIGVDRGSKSLLAQKATGVDNILQVKAATDTFVETNLSVITADGKLTSFIVRFNRSPIILNISLIGSESERKISQSPERTNDAELSEFSKAALKSRKKFYNIFEGSHGIKFELTGLFINNDILYFRVFFRNTSSINYDIDQLRFYIRDRKARKRTSIQEIEIKPIYVENKQTSIAAHSQQNIVFALPKFTIPDGKNFFIQVMEKNGGRNYELKLSGRHIFKAFEI